MGTRKFDIAKYVKSFKRPTTGQLIFAGIGLAAAIALFIFLRGFVTCWRLTSLPGVAPSYCTGLGNPPVVNVQGTPVDGTDIPATPDVGVPPTSLPEPWDGASRVSILVMGYDYGDWASDRQCPCRTDSMMVLTIDPLTKTAAMLSVQRDMWVNIPDFGYYKINTANYLGDAYKLPGGGPELARRTVENFLGIPIQYYVMLDFNSFITIVQTIAGEKGICMVIPADIVIDPLGEDNTTTLAAGPDCLNGAEVLAYARARHTANDDIDRSGRQQQVIMAVRDRLLDPGNFLSLLSKAPTLYNQLSDGIKTNFPGLNDAERLAVLALQIPPENIQKHVIDYTMSAPGKVSVNGEVQDILRPFPDKIRELVDQIFGTGSIQPMAVANPTQLSLEDAAPLMQQEAARVIVVNASGQEGIGTRTADYLKAQGMNVINFGNTADFPDSYSSPPLPDTSMIIVHSGKPYAIQYLSKLMNIGKVTVKFDPNAAADIIIAVGGDWASTVP